MSEQFKNCEICGLKNWKEIYHGKIRDGVFGKFKENCKVASCVNCKVHRLEEYSCLDLIDYEKISYRKKLNSGIEIESYFEEHDKQISLL